MIISEGTKHGGAWLGAVRNWIQWHCGPAGSHCTWGSNEVVKSNVTVREIEEIGAEAVESDRRDMAKYPLRKMLVFDNKLWNGKDVGDNSQFWKEAFILREYGKYADVLFLHDGRVSMGHIQKEFKIIIPGVQEEKR